ncbi:MAG: hypothetical protein AAGD38_22005 [Acidobacteriota bacterium]
MKTIIRFALPIALAATPLLAQPHLDWDEFSARHDLDGNGTVSAQELADSSGHFTRLDVDGDGGITASDLNAVHTRGVIAKLAHRADDDRDGTITASEWQLWFDGADANGDGVLNADDRQRANRPKPRRGGLTVLDTNEDGGLDFTELQSAAATLDINGDGVLSDDELPQRRHRIRGDRRGGMNTKLSRFDTDGDGSVSREEWVASGPSGINLDEHAARFDEFDTDGDGVLTSEELPRRRHRRGRQ